MKCYICGGNLVSIGSIPFDKNEGILPCLDKTPMEYHKCQSCNFICSLEMLAWTKEQFSDKVYNKEYTKVDTGYGGARASNNILLIDELFRGTTCTHLDYGSGEGHFSNMLREKGWDSSYYDPYSSPQKPNRKFKLITAIEVFEHSTNIFKTLEDIKSLLDRNGVILFTTRLADVKTTISWWYICARSGHIGIHSEKSLKIVAKKNNLFFSSLDDLIHIMQPTRNSMKELIRGYT